MRWPSRGSYLLFDFQKVKILQTDDAAQEISLSICSRGMKVKSSDMLEFREIFLEIVRMLSSYRWCKQSSLIGSLGNGAKKRKRSCRLSTQRMKFIKQ